MTTTTPANSATGRSAEIILFPFRERVADKALPAQKFAAMEAAARRYSAKVANGSWYHDDAIAEALGKAD